MNEKSDSMEKKSTPTPGARYRKRTRTKSGSISWRTYRKSNTPIGGRLRAKGAGSGREMASFNIGAYQTKPADSQHNKPAEQSW